MRELLKPKEAAKLLGVSYVTFLRFVHEGKIPAVRLFGTRNFKIDPADVERFVEESKSGAIPGAIRGSNDVEIPETAVNNVSQIKNLPTKRKVYGPNWAEEVRRRAR